MLVMLFLVVVLVELSRHHLNNYSTAARNAMVDGVVDLMDVGSSDASGDILIYDAGFSTLLVTLTMSNPACGASSSGVGTFNSITGGTAVASGTAAVCRWRDRDNGTVVEGTVGTSGADINLNTTTIATSDDVTMPGPNTFTAPS